MRIRRILAELILIAFIITSYGMYGVYGADIPVQPAPSGLKIAATKADEPAIGYSQQYGGESGFYADITWDNLAKPSGITVLGQYINIYLEESSKGYKPSKPAYAHVKGLDAGSKPVRLTNLKSGTVYKANARAYYEYPNPTTPDGPNLISEESANSNSVRFMTDINVQCFTAGTGQIKIVWDDVWVDGKRISYKLYVSEDKDFKNTFPITISEDNISKEGPVVVNESDGTLEYVQNVKNSGRVYYVKLVPILDDKSIVTSGTERIYAASTYIVVKTTNTSENIWKLEWSPVLTSLSGAEGNVKVEYEIISYDSQGKETTIAVKTSTMHVITVQDNSSAVYYKIRANVTKDGLPYYPPELNIKIESEKFALVKMETPTTPSKPVIVDEIYDSTGKVIISYKGELGKDTATVLWEAPKKADGTIDNRVLYDIWLVEDESALDNPPASALIQESYLPVESNFVRDTTNNNQIVGYKYKLTNLKQNHTYYFKIVAKKIFAEDVDGVIQNVTRISIPAVKLIVTPTDGDIDTPLIPSNPPLEIKKQADTGNAMITENSVTIQLKNRWYELYDKIPNTGKWYYVKTDRTSRTDTEIEYDPYDPNNPSDKKYRKVEYGEGVSLYVACEEYVEGIEQNISNLIRYPVENYKIKGISANPIAPANQDAYENLNKDLNAPDGIDENGNKIYSAHNIIIPVNELKPNTTYILWVRATRPDPDNPGQLLISDVSNPLIFTTLPVIDQDVEKPTVPELRYSNVSDTYVDLVWDYKEGYKYYIKYGTVDDPNKAGNTVEVTTEEILASGLDYLRISGLKPNTQYYFWIQAEAFNQDKSKSEKSIWSDSLLVKTLSEQPPATPRGFGVKNTPDAVTKTTITFEWIQEEGLEYILEIATSVDFNDSKEYNAGSASEFTVTGLISNHKYYARLYAYDPTKKLRSQPTQSIYVRTRTSTDDYDSDKDVDNVISGDYISKGVNAIGGVWTIKIVGVNADRLVEKMKTDRVLDYTVDMTKPPAGTTSISVWVAKRVFDNLEQLQENIAFKTAVITYDFRAGILSDISTMNTKKEQIYIIDIVLTPQRPVANANELVLKKPLAQIGVTLDTGADVITVSKFSRPLVIGYPYTNSKEYTEGETYGYLYNPVLSKWEQRTTSAEYDPDNSAGSIYVTAEVPGLYAFADRTNNLFDDTYGNKYESSIINVAYKYKLKSVNGRKFNPDKNITVGDAVKIVFDTIDNYQYGSDYMLTAVKVGLTNKNKQASSLCTRQEAAAMATILYEIKSGTRTKADLDVIKGYSDFGQVDKTILSKVAFAAENGFIPNSSSAKLNPNEYITRGEFMYMIEKALILLGEIE